MIDLLGRKAESLQAKMHGVVPASAAMVAILLPATTMAPQRARGAQERSSRGGGSDLQAPSLERDKMFGFVTLSNPVTACIHWRFTRSI